MEGLRAQRASGLGFVARVSGVFFADAEAVAAVTAASSACDADSVDVMRKGRHLGHQVGWPLRFFRRREGPPQRAGAG